MVLTGTYYQYKPEGVANIFAPIIKLIQCE